MDNNISNKKPLFDSGDFINFNKGTQDIGILNNSQNINGSNQYHQTNPEVYENYGTNDLSYENHLTQSYDDVTMDVPPILGEIPNLSEANKASAPTGDVLDPMNIMPEKINPLDELDAYEMNFPVSGIKNDYMMNQTPDLPVSDLDLNHFENPVFNNQESKIPGIKTDIDNFDIKEDTFLPGDNEGEHQFSSPQLEPLPNMESIDLEDEVKEFQEDGLLSHEDDMLLPEDEVLEIKPISISEDESVISAPINKIKSIVNELKESGAKIRLEEFDFENMYQIIIKIDK